MKKARLSFAISSLWSERLDLLTISFSFLWLLVYMPFGVFWAEQGRDSSQIHHIISYLIFDNLVITKGVDELAYEIGHVFAYLVYALLNLVLYSIVIERLLQIICHYRDLEYYYINLETPNYPT